MATTFATEAILCHVAVGDYSMMLLSHWKKSFSVGMLAATGAGFAQAQDPGMPYRAGQASVMARPAGYQGALDGNYAMPMEGMAPDYGMGDSSNCDSGFACDESCDACGDSCDGCDSCDSCDGLGLMGSRRLFQRRAGVGPMMGPGCEDFAQIDGGRLWCKRCGYAGCARCGWGLGLLIGTKLQGLRGSLRPYAEGGVATQRWFDLSADAIAFRRAKGAGGFNYSSQGVGTNNIRLSNNDVDLDQLRVGFQFMANIQTGMASSLETVYFGLNKWDETATVLANPVNTPTLFSFISNFGTDPVNGFDDPDRSFRHSLNYTSAIHNAEINFRRRWVGPYGWLQGSCLSGVRYFDLDESLTFSARGENNDNAAANGLRFFDYNTQTRNQLTGFQLGADLWMNVIPGIKVGVETKGGVFGNHAEQGTRITANSIPNLQESATDGRTAFLGQLATTAIYRLNHSWTMRGSYQILYVDNVSLAPENINTQPPALILPNNIRTVSINTDGEVRYEGFSVGAEYTW